MLHFLKLTSHGVIFIDFDDCIRFSLSPPYTHTHRHALRENLNVAMPLKGNYLSRTELFNRSSVLNTPWGGLPVDIFTLHNRWNRDQVMALMGPSTFAFSVVRDPVDQFESLYNYMGLRSTYKTVNGPFYTSNPFSLIYGRRPSLLFSWSRLRRFFVIVRYR